jgi:hypothetical protein
MADGFLGRWAQRKQAVREGRTIEEPVVPAVAPTAVRAEPAEPTAVVPTPLAEPLPPPPTLEETRTLTPQSDFRRFIAPDVDPEVKNAAMKKLFADPHFNVMDRMDVYIDDYSLPDPLPESMLRQMASAKFLKLFADEEENDKKSEAGLTPSAVAAVQTDNPATAEVTREPPSRAANLNDKDHADPDLRLQQDHAAGPQRSGGGA